MMAPRKRPRDEAADGGAAAAPAAVDKGKAPARDQRMPEKTAVDEEDSDFEREIGSDEEEVKEASNGSGDESIGDEGADDGEEMIQVDFEFFDPSEKDFHGLKMLLDQLWEKNTVDLSALADLVIRVGSLGSCVKVEGSDDPYALLTVLDLTEHRDERPIRQIVSYVLDRCPSEHRAAVEALLSNTSKRVGLMLNERLINMPVEPTVAMLRMTLDALAQRPASERIHSFLFVVKTYRERVGEPDDAEDGDDRRPRKAAKVAGASAAAESELLYYNDEEEILQQHATIRVPFKLKRPQSKWTVTDVNIRPERMLCVIPAERLPAALKAIEDAFGVPAQQN